MPLVPQAPAFGAGDVVGAGLEFWLGQIWGLKELELRLWLGLVLEFGLELEGWGELGFDLERAGAAKIR